MTPSLKSKLLLKVDHYNALMKQMVDEVRRGVFTLLVLSGTLTPKQLVKLSKETGQLKETVETIAEYNSLLKQISELEAILNDKATEVELLTMAQSELVELRPHLLELEHDLLVELIPKDEADDGDAIIELRPGTGGLEAGLFARDMFAMYQKYAEEKGWRFEPLTLTENEAEGLREGTACIKGEGVFAALKYESGVHRVQRIPETETNGRVHTSTMTVAVLPEAENVDIEIKNTDLRIETKRASGAGGQHVNTTDSAVRITHIPTGIVVSMQDERSQHRNKDKAMQILRARIYEQQRQKVDNERASTRKSQVGTGERSERIRTYNFPQDRVTDHRINQSWHGIHSMLSGEYLDEIVGRLTEADQMERLAELAQSDSNL